MLLFYLEEDLLYGESLDSVPISSQGLAQSHTHSGLCMWKWALDTQARQALCIPPSPHPTRWGWRMESIIYCFSVTPLSSWSKSTSGLSKSPLLWTYFPLKDIIGREQHHHKIWVCSWWLKSLEHSTASQNSWTSVTQIIDGHCAVVPEEMQGARCRVRGLEYSKAHLWPCSPWSKIIHLNKYSLNT